jgi:hypothetical protein
LLIPKEIPTDLIAALAREFASVKSIRGAWLMLATRGGEQGWMLGVDHKGSWQDVRDAIGRAVAGDILGGRDARRDAARRQRDLSHLAHRNSHHRRQGGFFQKLFS